MLWEDVRLMLISSPLKPLSPDQIQLSIWSSGAETSPWEVNRVQETWLKQNVSAQSFCNCRGCHVKGTVQPKKRCMATLMFAVLVVTRPQSKPHAGRTNKWQFWVYHFLADCSFNTFVSSTFLHHAGLLLLTHLRVPVVCAVTHAVHEPLNVSTLPPFCSRLYGPRSVTSQLHDGHTSSSCYQSDSDLSRGNSPTNISPPGTTYISPSCCSRPSLPKTQNDVNISRKLILSSLSSRQVELTSCTTVGLQVQQVKLWHVGPMNLSGPVLLPG